MSYASSRGGAAQDVHVKSLSRYECAHESVCRKQDPFFLPMQIYLDPSSCLLFLEIKF